MYFRKITNEYMSQKVEVPLPIVQPPSRILNLKLFEYIFRKDHQQIQTSQSQSATADCATTIENIEFEFVLMYFRKIIIENTSHKVKVPLPIVQHFTKLDLFEDNFNFRFGKLWNMVKSQFNHR